MDIPGNSSTTATVAIGGSFTNSLEVAGDKDWIKVDLVAGESYLFTLNGSGGNPLFDPFLEIRGSDGSLLSQDDDAGPGLNPSMKFTAPATGTYYLVARSYEDENQSPTAGGYIITADTGPAQNPLDAIDWGTKLSSNFVNVFFVPAGQSAGGEQSSGWSSSDISAVMNVLSTISDVANLVFTQVFSAAGAQFRLVRSTNSSLDYSGSMRPPGTSDAGAGIFNANSPLWTGGLGEGKSGFALILHEILHGLGLAHPHDNGGNSEVLQGVTDPDNIYGVDALNQGIYTNLSYNDGFPSEVNVTPSSGQQAGPAALDIALLQQKYGANNSHNVGDNVYSLAGGVQPGSYFSSIWDSGGTDLIRYTGASKVTIDLRPATLALGGGAGGYVSRVFGAASGFTIAAGVTIENATGGSGADTLRGNDFNNYLTGGPGNDSIDASDGADTISGGAGNDWLDGGEGDDLVYAGADSDQVHGRGGNDTIAGGDGDDNLIGYEGDDAIYGGAGNDSLGGYEGADLMTGNAGNDSLWGGPGADSLYGGDDDDRIYGDEDNDLISGTKGDDTVYGGAGNDTLAGGNDNDILFGQDGDDLVAGTLGQDTVYGDAGNDTVLGGDGDDLLYAGADNDALYGGNGMDTLYGGDGNDLLAGANDVDELIGEDGDDTLFGGGGSDILRGGDGVNELYGNAGNDLLAGGADADLLNGGDGDDNLTAGGSGDILLGDTGADTLIGGPGDDTMNGGEGDDRFEFYVGDGSDVINGFTAGAASEDAIFISGYGTAFDEFADIAAAASDDGTNTTIDLGGGASITLNNVLVADLHQDDFLFG